MKKLGFGAMRLPLLRPDDQTSVDMETAKRMFDAYLAAGYTYFDTAYFYHDGKSEEVLRELVVKRYPREAFTITDKLPFLDKLEPERMQALFDEQLARCGVEYFDYYWLHSVTAGNIENVERVGAFDFLKQKKAEGKTRHIGFSYHDGPELLDRVLAAHPEVEYVQLQINYLDWEDPKVQSRACYEVCVKHHKPVIVMEPVKGGRLAKLPEAAEACLRAYTPDASIASWGIRFAASLENVAVVLSGMSTPEQLADNMALTSPLRPLNETEQTLVRKAAEIIRAAMPIGCTGCRYCTDGCPQGIPIPDIFKIYNDMEMFPANDLAYHRAHYAACVKERGKASDCVACRQCEEHCPQHLDITGWLQRAAERLE